MCPKAGAGVTGRLSGVVAPRLRQRHPSRSSRAPHRSAAVRTECCSTAGQSSWEVRARDAITTRSSLAQGWSKGRVQTDSAGVPLPQRSGTTLLCQ